MRHKQNKKKLFIAVILAIAAGLTVYNSISSEKATINTLSLQLQEQQKTIATLKETAGGVNSSVLGQQVAVAKTDIKAGTKLTPEMMELKEYTAGKLPDDSIRDLNTLVGQTISEDITLGNPITKSKTLGLRYESIDIPQGMRAITIPVSYIQGLASYIKVGSKIDVVTAKKDNNPEFVLQGVRIISMEGANVSGSESPSSKADAITLLVPANSVPRLVDAMINGKLQVVARGFSDNHVIKNYVHINRTVNSYSPTRFTLPPPPSSEGIKLTGINDTRHDSVFMPPIRNNTKKVEIIQANVKSEIDFSNDL